MQNPSLIKDLTILVIDSQVGFGNGRVFPAGPLRERVSNGLSRVDIGIAIGSSKGLDRMHKEWPELTQKTILQAALKPIEMGMDWSDQRFFAFAGIGRPQKFYDTLESLGAQVVGTRSFDDHEPLSDVMLQRLERDAMALNAQLVTTEKDAVRIPDKYRQSVLALPVRLDIKTPDPLDQALGNLFK
jgi:tetraacyldisaccharide 4'-kinase